MRFLTIDRKTQGGWKNEKEEVSLREIEAFHGLFFPLASPSRSLGKILFAIRTFEPFGIIPILSVINSFVTDSAESRRIMIWAFFCSELSFSWSFHLMEIYFSELKHKKSPWTGKRYRVLYVCYNSRPDRVIKFHFLVYQTQCLT